MMLYVRGKYGGLGEREGGVESIVVIVEVE